MPEILFEGRRVVNNIARIAPIFFIKTIYSFLLAIICVSSLALGADMLLIFPFIPIQITIIDQLIEGFPPFILTFERNQNPIEKDFLKKSMFAALPSALMVIFSVIFVRFFGVSHGWNTQDISTASYYLLGSISFLSVIRACLPFNWLRFALVVETFIALFASAILFRPLLEIGTLNAKTFPIYASIMIISIIIFTVFSTLPKYINYDKIKS